MSRIVYFNGRFVPEADARVSIYDSALLIGDMAYEVTRTIHQRPYRLREHLQRLWNSLAVLRIDPGISQEALERATLETLEKNLPLESSDVDWSIMHDVSRGPSAEFRGAFAPDELRPTVIVACYPIVDRLAAYAPRYTSGIDLVVPEQRSIPTTIFNAQLKCRSRAHFQVANLQAAEMLPGASAALVDPDGHLTEGTSGNLFFVSDGTLFTPSARNILPGITRDTVLQLAKRLGIPTEETDITPMHAEQCVEVFLTSTSIGILHARSFNRKTVGNGQAGPVTLKLRAALYEEVGLDFAQQATAYARRN